MIKVAATVTIKKPAHMSKQGRRAVANWIRRQAYALEHQSATMATTYTAKYWYIPRGD